MRHSRPDPLIETLKLAARAVKERHIPFAVVGSCAAYARGAAPPRHDVDLAVRARDSDRVVAALTDAGLVHHACPEDWLVKIYNGDVLIDVLHELSGRPVTLDLLARVEERDVASVRMPVLDATELAVSLLMALDEHACDLSPALTMLRAIREQVDWPRVDQATRASPYARAFLELAARLGIIDRGTAADAPLSRTGGTP